MGTSSTGHVPAHSATARFPALYFAAMDRSGRLSLRAAAADLRWSPSQTIGLTVEGGLLRLSDLRGAFIGAEGTTATLDERWRITFPDDISAKAALLPGTRVVLMTTVDRGLLVVPTTRLVRQVGNRLTAGQRSATLRCRNGRRPAGPAAARSWETAADLEYDLAVGPGSGPEFLPLSNSRHA